jgi:choline-sulfatase
MQICNDPIFRFLLIFEALAKRTYTGQEQHHGFHARLTTDIYPADLGWTVDWKSNERQEWYHDMSSVTQAGPCVRSNQMAFDDEVTFASKQYLYDYAR